METQSLIEKLNIIHFRKKDNFPFKNIFFRILNLEFKLVHINIIFITILELKKINNKTRTKVICTSNISQG